MSKKTCNVFGPKHWLVDYLVTFQHISNDKSDGGKEKGKQQHCQENPQSLKSLPRAVNVLKHMDVKDGNVIKQVTDGKTWIRGVFTPNALLKFTNMFAECSLPDWNRSRLLLNKYFSHFVHFPDLHWCEFQLIIEEFELVFLEHGFHHKNDIEFIMDHPKVQELSAANLKLIKPDRIGEIASIQNQDTYDAVDSDHLETGESHNTIEQTSESHNLSILEKLALSGDQSSQSYNLSQLKDLEQSIELTSDHPNTPEDLQLKESQTFQGRKMSQKKDKNNYDKRASTSNLQKDVLAGRPSSPAESEVDEGLRTCGWKPILSIPSTRLALSNFITPELENEHQDSIQDRSNVHTEDGIRTLSWEAGTHIPSTKLILSSFITSTLEKELTNAIPEWNTTNHQEKRQKPPNANVADVYQNIITQEEDCATESNKGKSSLNYGSKSSKTVPQSEQSPIELPKNSDDENVKTHNVDVQVGDSLDMLCLESQVQAGKRQCLSVSCQVGDSLAMGSETQPDAVNDTERESTQHQLETPHVHSPCLQNTDKLIRVPRMAPRENADDEDGQRIDSSDSNDQELGVTSAGIQSELVISNPIFQQPRCSETDTPVDSSCEHRQSTQLDHITNSQISVPDFPMSPLKPILETESPNEDKTVSEMLEKGGNIQFDSHNKSVVADEHESQIKQKQNTTAECIARPLLKASNIAVQEAKEKQRLEELRVSLSHDLSDAINVSERNETERLRRLSHISTMDSGNVLPSSVSVAYDGDTGEKCTLKPSTNTTDNMAKDVSFSLMDNWNCVTGKQATTQPMCPPACNTVPEMKKSVARKEISLTRTGVDLLEAGSKQCSEKSHNVSKTSADAVTTQNIIQEDGLILPVSDIESTPVKRRKSRKGKEETVDTEANEEKTRMCLRTRKTLQCPVSPTKQAVRASKRTSLNESTGPKKKTRYDPKVMYKKPAINKPTRKGKHKLYTDTALETSALVSCVEEGEHIEEIVSPADSANVLESSHKIGSSTAGSVHVCDKSQKSLAGAAPAVQEVDQDVIELTSIDVPVPSTESLTGNKGKGTDNSKNGDIMTNNPRVTDQNTLHDQNEHSAKEYGCDQMGEMMDLNNETHCVAKKHTLKPHRFFVKKPPLRMMRGTVGKGNFICKDSLTTSSCATGEKSTNESSNEHHTKERQSGHESTSPRSSGDKLSLPTPKNSLLSHQPQQPAAQCASSQDSYSSLICDYLLRIEELLQKEADLLKENRVHCQNFPHHRPVLKHAYLIVKKNTKDVLLP